jgi:hypothetical protein
MLRRTVFRGLCPKRAPLVRLTIAVAMVGWHCVGSVSFAATYYVAPTGGSDSNAGSLAAPFGTISHAVSVAGAGDTIYLRGGTYNLSSTVTISVPEPGSITILFLGMATILAMEQKRFKAVEIF